MSIEDHLAVAREALERIEKELRDQALHHVPEIKTVENPSTKDTAARKARRCWETEAPSPSDSSSSVAPVMKQR